MKKIIPQTENHSKSIDQHLYMNWHLITRGFFLNCYLPICHVSCHYEFQNAYNYSQCFIIWKTFQHFTAVVNKIRWYVVITGQGHMQVNYQTKQNKNSLIKQITCNVYHQPNQNKYTLTKNQYLRINNYQNHTIPNQEKKRKEKFLPTRGLTISLHKCRLKSQDSPPSPKSFINLFWFLI